jgi:prophage regulatory protein
MRSATAAVRVTDPTAMSESIAAEPATAPRSRMPSKARVRIIRIDEVIDRTSLSKSTILRMARLGDFPASVPLGEYARGWVEAEVDAWLDEKMAARRA